MGCKVALGDICSFSRGASVPRARMFDKGDFLYIHYGDLYKGFNLRIDVENPAKPIPYISGDEKIKDSQRLCDQDIVYVLTSETVDDLGHAYLFNNPLDRPAVSGTETTVVRVERRDLIVPAYLNYLLSTPHFISQLRQYVRGMKVFRVHPNDVARIEVELPSISAQKQIVAVLDTIFEKQQVNAKLNDYLAQLCEAIAEKYCEAGEVRLGDICHQVTDKANCEDAKLETYVSTESLLQNKQGRQQASSLPTTGKVTLYAAGDTLVSNIRPYFKKVWYAPFDGTCSGDVLVFRANEAEDAPYLHACLRQDRFFDHVMRGAKGTKMPRGDKKQMMEFCVSSTCGADDLSLMKAALNQIAANDAESANLEDLRDTLLPKLMSGEIDVSKVDLTQLNSHLA